MTTQGWAAWDAATMFWILAAVAAATAVLAGLADRRRHKRRDLDRPGWVPWPLVQLLAMLLAAVAAALALKV
jgi:hypothetical protein